MAISSPRIQLDREQSMAIVLTGGLNEQISNVELNPGELIVCSNYVDQEDIYSGYQSVRGYERYDGTTLASTIDLDVDPTAWSAASVSYVIGDYVTYNDYIFEALTNHVSSTLNAPDSNTPGDSIEWEYLGLAGEHDITREARRTAIGTVGGAACSGPVSGVHEYKDSIYAWRNDAEVVTIQTFMYKATGTGWTIVDTSADPMNPDATVKAINGRFSSQFSNAEVMVWVDGVTSGFYVYNGTTVTFYDNTSTNCTNLPSTAPKNLGIWKNRLFLIYDDGHIFFSSVGDPLDFLGANTAGEIFVGGDVTDIIETPQGTFAIFTKDTTKFLYYETDPAYEYFAFRLDTFSNTIGSKPNTAKNILGTVYFADAQGILSLATTQAYGDFGAKSVSKKVQKTFALHQENISFSVADVASGRYYLFYTDSANTTNGLVITFKGTRIKGITKVAYKHKITCVTESRTTDGNHAYYFGDSTGYVMKMFSGTSFDGQEIVSFLTTSYYGYRSPRTWKFFHRMKFEASSNSRFTINIKSKYNYSESNMPSTNSLNAVISGAPGVWDEDLWDSFVWSDGAIANNTYYFTGYGTNMSVSFRSASKYKDIHNIHNITIDYSLQSTQV